MTHPWRFPETTLKIAWNTFETLSTSSKNTWNILETETPMKNVRGTFFKQPWNTLETALKFPWFYLESPYHILPLRRTNSNLRKSLIRLLLTFPKYQIWIFKSSFNLPPYILTPWPPEKAVNGNFDLSCLKLFFKQSKIGKHAKMSSLSKILNDFSKDLY